jgi:hypothetical protein
MASPNQTKYFLTLSNNAVVIGGIVEEKSDYIKLSKPYLLINDGSQILLIPYLVDIINQNVNEIVFLKSNIINIIEVQKTKILDTYLKEITGIQENSEIII